jgi:hypothetical protein
MYVAIIPVIAWGVAVGLFFAERAIAKERTRADALAEENAELRREVECLRQRSQLRRVV